MAPSKPPLPESLFCPFQEEIEDIRIHIWNTSKGLEGWFHLQEAMKRRQTRLAPFTIVAQGRTIPVTPLENPKTKRVVISSSK
ncbi:hypothetical protein GQ55_2G422600 [Panicum hallii var. hallii]|uniref:Uncharacterized protein n=1 Tax=Panicum hallii var. hallii TaxID=1504633 RepID=A0A2T7EY72_9POAL|nr:hypothetical protein GQ55_2G422600 [Panicum hallii var. hallii]